MANTRVLRMSFAGGELSPRMFGRADDAKYQAGAERLRNFIARPQGAAENRPGFQFVAETKDSTKASRIIPFKFSNTQTMALEFGDFYIRFHVDGAPLLIDPGDKFAFQASTTVTFNFGGDLCLWPAHVLTEGEPVVFTTTGTMPNELLASTVYYVRNPAAGQFHLSETPTGPIINLTSAGTPTITGYRRYSLADIVVYDDGGGDRNYYCLQENDSTTPILGFPIDWYTMPLGDIYEIQTFYPAADLFQLKYDQSFDVLSLTHPTHFPRELRRLGATKWTWVPVILDANVEAPNGLQGTDWNGVKIILGGVSNASPRVFTTAQDHGLVAGDSIFLADITTDSFLSGSEGKFYVVDTPSLAAKTFTVKTYSGGVSVGGGTVVPANEGSVALALPTTDINNRYVVTAIDAGQNESDPSDPLEIKNNLFVSGAFNTICWNLDLNDVAVRWAVYKERDGLYGFIGQVENDGRVRNAIVTSVAASDTINSTAHGLETGDPVRFDAALPFHTMAAPLVQGQVYYARKVDADNYQLSVEPAPESPTIVITTSTTMRSTRMYSFTDDNIAPDQGTTPPIRDAAELNGVDDYPGAVAHFEQRRCFAGTNNDPQTFWATRSNTEGDLAYSLPTRDDDRLKFKVASREQQTIRHIVPLGELLLLTDAAEWRVSAVNSEALTPDTISVRPQSYVGANHVRPVITNYAMLFAAARGGHIREMSFNLNVNGYVTGDLSLRAIHLFDNLDIVDMAHARAPHSLVYAVSSDGKLLVLTYVPEEQVGAWTWFDTDGTFESVAVIPEGDEDVAYVIVNRTIGGGTKRYVERLSSRDFAALEDATFLDSFLTYDGAATSTISGLGHLEGKTVSILADGVVHPDRVVASGAITLEQDASKVHVGLAYTSDLLTLPLTVQMEAFGIGRTKNVGRVLLRLVDSAGVQIGPSETELVDMDPYDDETAIRSESVDVTLLPTWTQEGQVLVRQVDPLPVTVVGMAIEVAIGG